MLLSLLKYGKMESQMIFHSKDKRKKVGPTKELLINVLYGLGVRGNKIGDIVGVSRATVYRHIHR